jgi:hypothetical protein
VFYQPPRALGLLVGVVLIAWSAGVALLLLMFAFGRELDLFTIGAFIGAAASLGVGALFGYWTYSLATISYAVDRNGLVINWGVVRQVIPLQAIERLVPGTAVGVPKVHGVSWLGHHVGHATIDRIGSVLFYSTHQAPEQVLYVMTTERNYAICVTDPASFAREIQVRQDLGPTAEVTHHVERGNAPLQALWADRIGLLLAGIAVLLGVALWVAFGLQYGGLPEQVQISFPASESSPLIEVTNKRILTELPQTATLLLAVNLAAGLALYSWGRAAAYAAFVAAALVQVGFIVAFQIAIRGL